ncbi:hypothetical protein F3K40_19195 [Streptomyces sp. LBUM 1478]|uniref:hypothetical protein n=1 Tax=Streptomyces scabiei TaxID=1930 RepID=UPI0007658BD5|nr:hypothetical protein [Streptomyces scabiei]MBP5907427.1 hypothetical protein [Streptomyces sp. LBUM 1478]MBP5929687.1 hypothetical protein [Streptomyces sp. LBUM 1479]MDX2535548.1 hypothetical protein [Streptomyces scabiei]MDX2796808.1 hypothetical protein [Streptomyces scabiei]MDX2860708.1 hypothetical protein [Streptomyces scabiei]
MNLLSTKTLGVITEVANDSSASELKNMLMISGLSDGDPPRPDNKYEIVRKPLLIARRAIQEAGEVEAHRDMLEFVRLLVESLRPFNRTEKLNALREALRSDGYELQTELNSDRSLTCRILPSEPEAAPLAPEITALEAELTARGYTEALGHYQLAVKHFAEQDHPSSNSQLRAALESLIVHLAIDHTGYIDNTKASQGGLAIKTLYVPGGKPPAVLGQPLPERDGGAMLQGIWDISHSNGSHPGLSDAQEARIRMQLITGLAQFLLRHFPV